MKKPNVYWIDLFCGAGGTTTGIHFSHQNVKVIACVNHDAEAIAAHLLNHPECKHFTEDIRDWAVIMALKKMVTELREREPDCIINIWASLECTHFSKAKGGMARDADSRTLGEHMKFYAEELNPDYMYFENVTEFLTWGPMNQVTKKEGSTKYWKFQQGKNKIMWLSGSRKRRNTVANKRELTPFMLPIKERKGEHYDRWITELKALGYDYEYEAMNAADHGAYTSRNRYFGIFAKSGYPIEFPEPTHEKKVATKKRPLNPNLAPWRPVKHLLNFELEGNSIFGKTKQGKDYSPNSFERVYAGLEKFIAKGETAYIKKYFSGRPKGKVTSLENPLGTITTVKNQALIEPAFIKDYSHHDKDNPAAKLRSVDEPLSTLTTKKNHAVVEPHFIKRYNGGNPKHKVHSVDEPLGAISTNKRHAVVKPVFLTSYYGNGGAHSIQEPCGTVTTKDTFAAHFLKYDYTSGGESSSIDAPAAAITARPKHSLIEAKWLMDHQFGNKGKSVEEPAPTIIARMDKKPLYLMETAENPIDQSIDQPDDIPIVRKIRKFMREYGIRDITIRMLTIDELKTIQGFPADYIMSGTKTDQMKFIGNSVVPLMAKKLVEQNYKAITEHILKLAA